MHELHIYLHNNIFYYKLKRAKRALILRSLFFSPHVLVEKVNGNAKEAPSTKGVKMLFIISLVAISFLTFILLSIGGLSLAYTKQIYKPVKSISTGIGTGLMVGFLIALI